MEMLGELERIKAAGGGDGESVGWRPSGDPVADLRVYKIEAALRKRKELTTTLQDLQETGQADRETLLKERHKAAIILDL